MALSSEQLSSPEYAFGVGDAFAMSLGVDIDPFEQPEAYAEAMHQGNPRTKEHLVRFQLEKSQQVLPQATQTLLDNTVEELGIMESEYPFPADGEYGAMVVCGGARDALYDRSMFAAKAIEQGVATSDLLIAGDPGRTLNEEERGVVEGWAPGAENEFDLARAATDILSDEYHYLFGGMRGVRLLAFRLLTRKPDQRDVIDEVILRAEGMAASSITHVGKLAVVTTAIYVPFKTHDTLSVAKRKGVDAEIVGVASRPDVISKRKPITYASEAMRTLAAAAHHQATLKRLG